MSQLFGVMNAAGSALKAFQDALDVTQNNVSNSQTPGYVTQIPQFDAVSFNLAQGTSGGVESAPPESMRSQYAESVVRQQATAQGGSSQLASSLDPIEQVFTVTGSGGISNALDALFQSFSAWSATPSDGGAQSTVVNAAEQAAATIQQSATQLQNIRSSVDGDLQTTVAAINQIAGQIQQINVARQGSAGASDPGLDAQLNAALEQLSQYGSVQTLPNKDGSVTVLLGGQIPLVSGDQVDTLNLSYSTPAGAANPNAAPNATIMDQNGRDETQILNQGQLGALLSVRNQVLPHLIGGPNDTGELNTLASSLADTVNGILAKAGGKPLFTYDSTSPTAAAATLQVTQGFQPSDLVAVDPGPPAVSNGTALKLSNLGSDPTQGPQGMTFSQFYGSSASWIGGELSQAQASNTAQTQTLAQARALRQQVSGVSLDEQALQLMQLQRSYQAASRMMSVIDQVTQSLIDMVQ